MQIRRPQGSCRQELSTTTEVIPAYLTYRGTGKRVAVHTGGSNMWRWTRDSSRARAQAAQQDFTVTVVEGRRQGAVPKYPTGTATAPAD